MAVTDYRLCCGYGNSGTDTRGFDCLIIPGARSQNGQDLNVGALHFHPWLYICHNRILDPFTISLDLFQGGHGRQASQDLVLGWKLRNRKRGRSCGMRVKWSPLRRPCLPKIYRGLATLPVILRWPNLKNHFYFQSILQMHFDFFLY